MLTLLLETQKQGTIKMQICHCGKAMIRADYYDPDGTIPLFGMTKDKDGHLWVCTDCGKNPNNKSSKN